MLRQKLSQRATLACRIGYFMAFINNDDVPACVFYVASETLAILQCINRYDGLVIIVEWILVERNNSLELHQ